MIPTIHPFPARMAPDLALETLGDLPVSSVVLDPMSGSGTVLRQASEMGHRSIGFDLDPLAVLMSRVWNTPVSDAIVRNLASGLIEDARSLDPRAIKLKWIDGDPETDAFVKFWFGENQRNDLRRIAYCLESYSDRSFGAEKVAALDIIRIALSRIIITKESCASLARDTSHSRPHKVAEASAYDVFQGLERSVNQVRKKLAEHPPWGGVAVNIGDARKLVDVATGSIDAVMTSPPYLNAIDYLRGHRLSLVWLGYSLSTLRSIRSSSIGAERAPDKFFTQIQSDRIQKAICGTEQLNPRHDAIVKRYCHDLHLLISEISRVTRVGGIATFVVGNSCLQGKFIRNASGVSYVAKSLGMKKLSAVERDLPVRRRYLPVTKEGALAARMRTESVLTFGRI